MNRRSFLQTGAAVTAGLGMQRGKAPPPVASDGAIPYRQTVPFALTAIGLAQDIAVTLTPGNQDFIISITCPGLGTAVQLTALLDQVEQATWYGTAILQGLLVRATQQLTVVITPLFLAQVGSPSYFQIAGNRWPAGQAPPTMPHADVQGTLSQQLAGNTGLGTPVTLIGGWDQLEGAAGEPNAVQVNEAGILLTGARDTAATNQYAVTATAGVAVPVPTSNIRTACTIHVPASSSQPVFIGTNSSLTVSNGYMIEPGHSHTVSWGGGAIYAVAAAAGTTISYWDE